jgi:hypothetical protein
MSPRSHRLGPAVLKYPGANQPAHAFAVYQVANGPGVMLTGLARLGGRERHVVFRGEELEPVARAASCDQSLFDPMLVSENLRKGKELLAMRDFDGTSMD